MSRRLLALVVSSAAAVAFAPTVAGASPASPSPAGPSLHAVVTVRPGATLPSSIPGGHVLARFPNVGAELVSAPAAALRALGADPRVAGVSPDRRGHVTGDDRGNDDGDGGSADGVLVAKAIGGDAGKAGTGQGVNVALLDTGVSDTAALSRDSGRITDGVDVSSLASGGDARTSGQFTDGYGHGTFMASLIAGGQVKGSGRRAIGVAPAARIVVVKVADSAGNTSLAEVLAGLDWVAAHARAIQVVNLSLSVDRPTAPAYGADPLTAAVEHVRAAGIVVVAAAGNVAGQVGDPGLDPQSLTVGAADVTGRTKVASFSGSGVVAGVSKPDVVAPGLHVLGVVPAGSAVAKANPQGWTRDGLFKGSGTSEAAAVTSGVAAAYLSTHPNASPLEVKAAIRTAADPMRDARAGAGLVSIPKRFAGSGVGAAGEAGFDGASWSANAWTGVRGWQSKLDAKWSGDAWSAATWSAATWSAATWSSSNWSAATWSAATWSAATWSAATWSAATWSAATWSDYGWGDA
ncbi:MAG: S8 family serine peptidase [Frankiaceae bacterium]|nr:S8 family serine peptidase [Frankiaceae bacterium]MBV9369277.1 S8 family serine peptidase [Frankiales bacterium]